MKRIINRVKVPNPIKQFRCGKCGCVFEADPEDYVSGFDYYGDKAYYYSGCPKCGNGSYAAKGEDDGE